MEAFDPMPPAWTQSATHALGFSCPACGLLPGQAQSVWINRQSPVYTENHRKKWQEFYSCQCGTPWWGWSSDRPATEFAGRLHPDDSNSTPDILF